MDRRQVFDEALRDYRQSHKTISDVLNYGASAFRPPSPLGLLSGGIEMVLPSSADTHGAISHRGVTVQFNNAQRIDNLFIMLFGRLDLVFIVTTILAMLVMIFASGTVAGEKERRTLSQIMAYSVPRPLVLNAKLAAGLTLHTGAFMAGVLSGILLITVLGIDPFGFRETKAPFWIGIGTSILFLFVVNSLGVLLSSLSRSPISAMVRLFSIWIAMAMIIPKGSVVASKFIFPVKSQQVIDLEKNQVRYQNEQELYATLKKLSESTPGVRDLSRNEYFRLKRANNPTIVGFEKKQSLAQDEFLTRLDIELNKIDVGFERQKEHQAGLARSISRISPVSCYVHVLTELAGTGFVEENAWQRTRSRLKQLLDREITGKMRVYSFSGMLYGATNLVPGGAAPEFPPERVPCIRRLAAVWIDIVLLMVYGILFYLGAYVAFLRYDVR